MLTLLAACSLLRTSIGVEAATTIVNAAKDKQHLATLCGIKPDQTEADLSRCRLGPGDAVLLSFDLHKNTVLVILKCDCLPVHSLLSCMSESSIMSPLDPNCSCFLCVCLLFCTKASSPP